MNKYTKTINSLQKSFDMFYEELYETLGKLFYGIAATDGQVTTSEEIALRNAVTKYWAPLEDSTDSYGTDLSAVINFSFDYADSEGNTPDPVLTFSSYYLENKELFTPSLIEKIMKTAEEIASAFHGINKKENRMLQQLEAVFSE